MNAEYRELIANEFRNCVQGTIYRITRNEQTYRPFHTALLSEDVIFWSAFERSFSTSFGQRVIEELARLVALANGADDAARQRETYIKIDEAVDNAIHNHIQELRDNVCQERDWDTTVKKISAVSNTGKTRTIRVISDLWWHTN